MYVVNHKVIMDTSCAIKPRYYVPPQEKNLIFKVFPIEIITYIFSFLDCKEKYSTLVVNRVWKELMFYALKKDCRSKIKQLFSNLKNCDSGPKNREMFDLLYLYAFSIRVEDFRFKETRQLKEIDATHIINKHKHNKFILRNLSDNDQIFLEKVSGKTISQLLKIVFDSEKLERSYANEVLKKMAKFAITSNNLNLAFALVNAMEVEDADADDNAIQATKCSLHFSKQSPLLKEISKRWATKCNLKKAFDVALTTSNGYKIDCLEYIIKVAVKKNDLNISIRAAESIPSNDDSSLQRKVSAFWFVAKKFFLRKPVYDFKGANELIFKIPDASWRLFYLEKISQIARS